MHRVSVTVVEGRIVSVKVMVTVSELAQPSALTVLQMKSNAPPELAEIVVDEESLAVMVVPEDPLQCPVLHVPVAFNRPSKVQLTASLPALGTGTK